MKPEKPVLRPLIIIAVAVLIAVFFMARANKTTLNDLYEDPIEGAP